MRVDACLLAALDVRGVVPGNAQLRLVLQGLNLCIRWRRGARRPQPCHALGCVRSHCSPEVGVQVVSDGTFGNTRGDMTQITAATFSMSGGSQADKCLVPLQHRRQGELSFRQQSSRLHGKPAIGPLKLHQVCICSLVNTFTPCWAIGHASKKLTVRQNVWCHTSSEDDTASTPHTQ